MSVDTFSSRTEAKSNPPRRSCEWDPRNAVGQDRPYVQAMQLHAGIGDGVTHWFRIPSPAKPLRQGTEHSTSTPSPSSATVSEVLSSRHLSMSTSGSGGDFGFFSILETPESIVDEETIEKFRTSFAFDEKEKLLGCRFNKF